MSNTSLVPCAVETTGFGPVLILGLSQALWATQLICSLSPSGMWPKDYGKTVVKSGMDIELL